MKLEKHLDEPWFSLMKIGSKKVEVRINKPEYKDLNKMDEITFFNELFGYRREIKTKVMRVKKYKKIRNLLEKETLKATVPGFQKIDKAEQYFTKRLQQNLIDKYGLIAIEITNEKTPRKQ